MRTKKYFLLALLLMPAFVACDKDNKDDGGSSLDQLLGEWSIKDKVDNPKNVKKLSLLKDGKYIGNEIYLRYKDDIQIVDEEFKTEGDYKYEDNVLATLTGETKWRESTYNESTGQYELGDWEVDDEVEFEGAEMNVSLKLGGSVMLMTKDDDPYTYFVYKEGASLPSDKSALKGTWICKFELKSNPYLYALKIDADSLELIIGHWEDRYVCKYEYKGGYINITECAYYGFDGREFNMDDPFDNEWELYDPEDDELGGIPMVVDGSAAYVRIFDDFQTFRKK